MNPILKLGETFVVRIHDDVFGVATSAKRLPVVVRYSAVFERDNLSDREVLAITSLTP